MSKKLLCKALSTLTVPMLLNTAHAQEPIQKTAQQQQKPNILFIFADDMCFDEMGAVGNKTIKTPNLDRLVEGGVLFTHAYNMGAWNGAVCMASRAMLNTGQFVWDAQNYCSSKEKPLWAKRMNNAGYDSYFTGKWHVHHRKPQKSFTSTGTVRGGMPNQTQIRYSRKFIEGQPDTWSPYDKSMGGFWKGGKHWSAIVADETISFINKAKNEQKPFFMYAAFNSPHDPRQAPKKYVDMYPLDKINVPDNFIPRYPYEDKIGLSRKGKNGKTNYLRDEKLAPMPRTPYAVKVNRQEYYALISYTDYQVGRILDALEKSGKADNTIIFFSADHGLAVGKHGLLGKQNMYDHSIRVPLIIYGKGIPKNKKIDADVYLQDIMASSLDLAKANRNGVKFKSLMPLISGEKKKSYDAIYCGYINFQRMIRKGDWKLILYPNAKVARLYNVKKDPQEMNDVASSPANKSIMKKLYKEFKKLQSETHDKLNMDKIFPELANK
ncbi:sulfatase-like hydrolase/transferase [Lentisphaerota bacterium WC36G]|nr:sulfatase-like hydrolase/transferase [Lentisphaerae bacterium WC36]